MKEIKATDIMHIGFLKKEPFTGSFQGMRYRMEKYEYELEAEGETVKRTELLVTVWPEPYAFSHTAEEEKSKKRFDFSEEGVEAGRLWLNEMAGSVDWEARRLH